MSASDASRGYGVGRRMQPQTAARAWQVRGTHQGRNLRNLEHLVPQDALAQAAVAAANWYTAHPTYAADSEAETMAALDHQAHRPGRRSERERPRRAPGPP
jgi:hypothetical protein